MLNCVALAYFHKNVVLLQDMLSFRCIESQAVLSHNVLAMLRATRMLRPSWLLARYNYTNTLVSRVLGHLQYLRGTKIDSPVA